MRVFLLVVAVALTGCGGTSPPEQPAEPAARRETVFDPMTSTIGRAQGVQQTVDAQAAEQRKKIEEAER
jgi:cytochrome c556